MIYQTIHEVMNPFDVETPLGYGVVLFMIAGSIHSNPQFIVRFYNTGQVAVSYTKLSNNRSVMPLDVRGRTRATLKG